VQQHGKAGTIDIDTVAAATPVCQGADRKYFGMAKWSALGQPEYTNFSNPKKPTITGTVSTKGNGQGGVLRTMI